MPDLLVGAFLDKRETYPTIPPELSQHVGLLCFAFVVAMLVWAWTRAESVRRALLALEDPRGWAVLRIGFAIMTIVCFVNLYPYWHMLWSDEGIFDLVYAQDRSGRSALRGWSPSEGFFDSWAVAAFLWNKPSLLYIEGHPDYVFGFMMVFFAVLVLYGLGMFSRVTGVIAWLMMSMVYDRNALYWEGTDTVYRAFWFILLFAKTGHAWSIDNWWRCRRLRRRGRLAEPGRESGDDDRQREPIYRLVPAWPRYLFMLQLAAIYITTGSVKTGAVWLNGDALYYALNMDHFYRFGGLTQWVSSIFATNLFRTMTWVTHWWERLFPLVLAGMVLRFGLLHRDKPWFQAQHRGARLWIGRAAVLAAYLLVWWIVVLSVPYCLQMRNDAPQDPRPALLKVNLAFGAVIPIGVLLWTVLGRWPVTLFRGGRSLGPITRRWPFMRAPELTIDRDVLRGWFLGRRLWLTLGFMFHGFLAGFMNIGMFPFIMLMTYAAFFTGDEFVRVFRGVVAKLRTRSWGRKLVPAGVDVWLSDPQPAGEVVVRGRPIPEWVVAVIGAAGVALMLAKAGLFPFDSGAKPAWVGSATYAWLGLIAGTAVAFRFVAARPIDRVYAQAGPALAYGTLGRTLALGAVVWHASAVGLHLFPAYAMFNGWRAPARAVFSDWLRGTGTAQGWRMFAPNPPRSNVFMRTVVVLENGDQWDLRNNAFEDRPNPWIINDRMRKMQRRMVGKGKWYLRYWGEYQCRQWALTRGETPREIVISKYVTHIPKPEVVNIWQPAKFKGRTDPSSGATTGEPYDPYELKVREVPVKTIKCKGDGELPAFIKERYGLPLTDEDREKAEKAAESRARTFDNRRETWERRRDWGRWWSESSSKPQKHPQSVRSLKGESVVEKAQEVADDGDVQGDEDDE